MEIPKLLMANQSSYQQITHKNYEQMLKIKEKLKLNFCLKGNDQNQPINPMYKLKFKADKNEYSENRKKSSIQRNSSINVDNVSSNQASERNALSEVGDFTNIPKDKKRKRSNFKNYSGDWQAYMTQMVFNLVLRVEKNQNQIERIHCKQISKDHNSKTGSDFRQIKQIYTLIRDQNKIQSELNKKINEQLFKLKQQIASIRQSIKIGSFNQICLGFNNQNFNQKSVAYQEFQKKINQHINLMNQQFCLMKDQINDIRSRLCYLVSNNQVKQIANKHQNYQKQNRLIAININSKQQDYENLNKIQQDEQKRKSKGLQKCEKNKIQKNKQICNISSARLDNNMVENALLYYIDTKGYLLDEEGYYLLNDQQQLVKIDECTLHRIKSKCNIIF